MLYLKAYKRLPCGCLFYAYITYCHYHCRASFQCNQCSWEKMEANEMWLEEEFNINLPTNDDTDYSLLIPLGWVKVEKRQDDFVFATETKKVLPI